MRAADPASIPSCLYTLTIATHTHKQWEKVQYTNTSTSNPFLCAADFFLQLGSCKEAIR